MHDGAIERHAPPPSPGQKGLIADREAVLEKYRN